MAENELEDAAVHIAVGRDEASSNSIMRWAIHEFSEKRLCIFYVYKPPKINLWERRDKKVVEHEKKCMSKFFDRYMELCAESGVSVSAMLVESENVEKGIVTLISRNRIKLLVMGSAPDNKYYSGMKHLASSKARYVNLHAPTFCEVVFICRGKVILTKKAERSSSSSLSVVPVEVAGEDAPSSSYDVTDPEGDELKEGNSAEEEAAHDESRKKEVAEGLMAGIDNLELHTNERDELTREIQNLVNQDTILTQQFAESESKMKRLEQKFLSSMELLIEYKTQLDAVHMNGATSSSDPPQVAHEFHVSEIAEATNDFNPSLKIGEGSYGVTYKGFLRHTEVAIKVRNLNSQGFSNFRDEVADSGRIRHPNVVTFIGTCPNTKALIHEYIPNGNLEDRLNCKDNSSPVKWQVRVRIASELCSVLAFLHSNKDPSFIHGNLKPSKVFLDGNLACKLSVSGRRHPLYLDPKEINAYLDPEFQQSGVLTTKSDVYSFGVILLRLLTRRHPWEVMNARNADKLSDVLDSSAGDWPFLLADQLGSLAMRCCAEKRENRPDLAPDVLTVLKSMAALCVGSHGNGGFSDSCTPPSYYICPIFQEVMGDPQVAADGYTYEAEAVRGWLESGHDTSPMTNLRLPHRNLVPNHALRSAIREWQQLRHSPGQFP